MNFPEKKPVLANLEGLNLKFSFPVCSNHGGASLNTELVPPQSKLCVAAHVFSCFFIVKTKKINFKLFNFFLFREN